MVNILRGENDMGGMCVQYSTVGDSRWGGGVGGLADQDDSEGWLRRQQALQQRWRDEDSAAAQDILAVACGACLLLHYFTHFTPAWELV